MPRVKTIPTPVTPLHGVLTPKNKLVVETTCLKHNISYPDTDPWKLLYDYDAEAKAIADSSDQPWPLVWTSRNYSLVDVYASNVAPHP